MIRKLLEAFFQHKLLLLLPPFLIPAIVTPVALVSNPPVYETAAGIWIDHAAYLTVKDDPSAWMSPVQSQSNRLSELLRTRAFVNDVAQRTSLAPLVNSTAGQTRIADLITRGVIIGGAGGAGTTAADHLMMIRVQAQTGQLSYELCKAIIDAYQEKTAADQSDQVGVAVDFYQTQLQDSRTQLTKASGDLRRYIGSKQLADNADGTTLDPTSALASMLDPKLSALQETVQSSQVQVKSAQDALTQAQQASMMWTQGQQYGFQILDAPQLPVAPVSQIKKLIIYPIAAALVGFGLTALLLVLLVASDRSVRAEMDLAPGLRLLGNVPTFELKNVPKSLRSVATRRAIGSAAGMALPSPSGAK